VASADVATAGVVLAGGASRRFGSAKSAALLAGRPLIEYPIAAMREAGLPVIVVAKADNDLAQLIGETPLLLEPDEPRHPLRGIVSALEHVGGAIVVCACDMPFVSASVVGMLARLDDPVAVAAVGGMPQPMLGRYDQSVLPLLRAALEGEHSVRRSLSDAGARLLGPEELAPYGDPEWLAFDVDTQEELERAERHLAR
jgi:molybdopterin-guanine dinucleotide biosynthesis protein A